MQRKYLGFILAATLALSGCATAADKSIFAGGTSITATIPNPININSQYDVEAAVALARRTSLAYFQLPQCTKSQVPTLNVPCARRSVKVQIQQANNRLTPLLNQWRTFVSQNDQISALAVAQQLWQAVQNFQATLATNGVQ